ncbi:Uncharacterized membrane protein YsdA, DUF1294 family [Salinibacillus kushneri]|uniref:Uncharacterized membrane protein YsdA, DUF1294 family n=1 Tax=Salinibacillus kushneri TaxID=237682 RepID=A0A1I0H4Q3_9BACI|nr:DUF1294 domain-containing protein [Salinibacillus kushneri]SET78548.1 Uncharacterized membrane protein YsdA, DUF1294 family [Salinibacillus kushneri]
MLERFFVSYIVMMNGIGFLSMGWDKRKAIKGKWRISEAKLFLIAFIGGAIGSTFGMFLFRHKTNKLKFKAGFPLLTGLTIAALFSLYKNLS